jgi:hypothetical protein
MATSNIKHRTPHNQQSTPYYIYSTGFNQYLSPTNLVTIGDCAIEKNINRILQGKMGKG